MLIYRIEHPSNQKGPYWTDQAPSGLYDAHEDDLHPAAYEDNSDVRHFFYNPNIPAENIRYGMPTLESLYEWFKGFILALHNKGFHLTVYEARPNQFAVGKQVIYNLKGASLVSSHNLLDAFKEFNVS